MGIPNRSADRTGYERNILGPEHRVRHFSLHRLPKYCEGVFQLCERCLDGRIGENFRYDGKPMAEQA